MTVRGARALSRCHDADVLVSVAESMRTSAPHSASGPGGDAGAKLASTFCLLSSECKCHVMRMKVEEEKIGSWKLEDASPEFCASRLTTNQSEGACIHVF